MKRVSLGSLRFELLDSLAVFSQTNALKKVYVVALSL